MSRLDKLIWQEMIGPFFFGTALFSGLIFATTLLVRITEWTVRGISPSTILQLVWLVLPALIVKTFGMALLLASLLSFGRLSNDSEIVALRAAGASLFRIMRPVLLFSLLVAVTGFALSETLVPGASLRATALSTDLRRELDSAGKGAKPVSQTITGKQGIVALVVARDFSLTDQRLSDVTIIQYSENGRAQWFLSADALQYTGPYDWSIDGHARLISADGTNVVEIPNGAWPKQVEKPNFSPITLLAGIAEDADAFEFRQLVEEIDRKRKDPHANERQIVNLEFGLYNKIAIPLGQVIFALLGAPLGIRNTRTGVGTGFAMSIVVTFGYIILVNFLAVYAKGGSIPAWVASFAPVAVGLVVACIAVLKKNA